MCFFPWSKSKSFVQGAPSSAQKPQALYFSSTGVPTLGVQWTGVTFLYGLWWSGCVSSLLHPCLCDQHTRLCWGYCGWGSPPLGLQQWQGLLHRGVQNLDALGRKELPGLVPTGISPVGLKQLRKLERPHCLPCPKLLTLVLGQVSCLLATYRFRAVLQARQM